MADLEVQIMRLRQADRDMVIDLSVGVGFQDFGFQVTVRGATPVIVAVYHTGEIDLFCQLLARAVADQSAAVVVFQVRSEVQRLTHGLSPVERAEHRVTDAEWSWRRATDAPPAGDVMEYVGSREGEELKVRSTDDGLRFQLVNDDGVRLTFDCPLGRIPSVLAGMMRRTYAEPDEVLDAVTDADGGVGKDPGSGFHGGLGGAVRNTENAA